MSSNNLELVGLDFDTIKANLKTYLKANPNFKDVDFDGSNISVLLDVLSYNTYLNAFYTNMVASEMFLDTAQLRESIISHAKELNYTPRSFVSAKATLDVDITPSTTVSSVVIPRYTSFTTRIGSNNYTFSTNEAVVISQSNAGVFSAELDIYEGEIIRDTFVVSGNTSQRFVLSNSTVDTKNMDVIVFEDSGDTSLTYLYSDSLIGITDQSQVYFIQAAENQQFEVVFGDDVFGRKPKNGAVVVITYRACSGELPNGASTFVSDGPIDGHTNIAIATESIAEGGAVAESIESIRYYAPRVYQTQNRAVTEEDYKVLLKSNFSEIGSVSVYGGESAMPPQYGKVIVSVDLTNADGVPESRKQEYKKFLDKRKPSTVDVVFQDPEFVYIDVVTRVVYDITKTKKTQKDIETLIRSSISAFNIASLDKFDARFFFSELLTSIDAADTSILGNDTDIRMIYQINPLLNTSQSFRIILETALEQETGIEVAGGETHYGHTLTTTPFTYNNERSIIVDDTQGNLWIAPLSQSLGATISTKIGTINYTNGEIVINSLRVSSYEGAAIKIYLRSSDNNIIATKNRILKIRDSDVAISITGSIR